MASSSPFAPPASAVLPVPLPPPPATLAVARPAPAALPPALRAVAVTVSGRARSAAALVASAALDGPRPGPVIDDDHHGQGVVSREWPENISLLSLAADLRAYLESRIVTSDQMRPDARLGDVMSRPVQVATPEQRLAEVEHFFATGQYSGLPVVDDEGKCVGVLSNKDKAKATNGLESTVGEVMSSPAITLTMEKIVLEAAALMLKEKVHRIPVVNEQQYVIGIVTRTDVFQALEGNGKA